VHQEDGCQATATPPGMKYEEQGGPALRDLAALLRNFGDPRDVTELLRRTTFNMAVGNADAHAKNFSVLHEADSPAIGLAPFYDVLSTIGREKLVVSNGTATFSSIRLANPMSCSSSS
jgi:serine/threonine-protein kinase HipA